MFKKQDIRDCKVKEEQVIELVHAFFHHDSGNLKDAYVPFAKKAIRRLWYSMAFPMDKCPVDETDERPPPVSVKRAGDSLKKGNAKKSRK